MKDILAILEQNGRATPQEISEITGHTLDDVLTIIGQAEQNRIIVKYKAVVNWDRVDEEEVLALVDVRVAPEREVGFDRIARRIARFPEVHSLDLMSGGYDLSVTVRGRNIQDVANFVATHLATIEEVHGTTTHFLLKRFKTDGTILDEEPGAKRLPLTP
jgi:DNA-binding Lrp family transcriptional regulator|tara:strand:+ start:99 stop:578 length:480 start_codon:yes stop_codon:yes gene_type:complete